MKSVLLVVLAGGLLFGAGTFAADTTLTQAQVKTKVEAAGYTNVHGIEREGNRFDADGMKDGKAVHLHVDAKTGAIKVVENEDEEHEKHEKDHD